MPPIFEWIQLIPIFILVLIIFGIPRIYKWRGYDKEGNKIIIRELEIMDKNYMKTTVVTATHKVTFENMGEAKELHGLLGSTIRAWELAGIEEMGPVKPIPPRIEKDPILDETV